HHLGAAEHERVYLQPVMLVGVQLSGPAMDKVHRRPASFSRRVSRSRASNQRAKLAARRHFAPVAIHCWMSAFSAEVRRMPELRGGMRSRSMRLHSMLFLASPARTGGPL